MKPQPNRNPSLTVSCGTADNIIERPCDRGAALKSTVRDVVETLILTAVIFLLVRAVVQNFKVEGRSMEPTLRNGQYLLINKAVYWPVDGELVDRIFPSLLTLPDVQDGAVYVFGEPPRDNIIGKAWLSYWPVDQLGFLTNNAAVAGAGSR